MSIGPPLRRLRLRTGALTAAFAAANAVARLRRAWGDSGGWSEDEATLRILKRLARGLSRLNDDPKTAAAAARW